MSASLTLEAAILGHTLGYGTLPATPQVFVALCMASATPTDQLAGIEVSGGGYQRMPAIFGPAASANIATNTQTLEFPQATGIWGDVAFFEIWSAAIGGNRLYWGALVDPTDGVTPTIETIVTGDLMRFPPGTLNVWAVDLSAAGFPWLPISGGTMEGSLLLYADPIVQTEAATKRYVDTTVGGGVGGPFLPINGVTLPTSNSGLAPGTLWNNGGFICVA